MGDAPTSAMDSLALTKMFVGFLYLVGGVLLQPGFYWIIPTGTFLVPPPSTVGVVPVFDFDNYVTGMNLLIVGVGMVLVSATVDFVFVHCFAPRNASVAGQWKSDFEQAETLSEGLTRTQTHRTEIRAHVGGNNFLRLFGPACQVLGAAVLLFGCIVLLPKYAGVCEPSCPPIPMMNKTTHRPIIDPVTHEPVFYPVVELPSNCTYFLQIPHAPQSVWPNSFNVTAVNMCIPRQIFGEKATDLGRHSFQAASIIYALGALVGIYGVVIAIGHANKEGRGSIGLKATILAFLLFIATSTLFFVNGLLDNKDCVEAGWLRMAAAICMLVAIIILFIVNGAESMTPQTTDLQQFEQLGRDERNRRFEDLERLNSR